MLIFIERKTTPALVLTHEARKLEMLLCKARYTHDYKVCFMGDAPTNLVAGIRARGEYAGGLLALSEVESSHAEQVWYGGKLVSCHVFDLSLNCNTIEVINSIGERDRIPALVEFSWIEGAEKIKCSLTLSCTILNSVIGDGSIHPDPLPEYPTAEQSWNAVQHLEEASTHITEEERTNWNGKADAVSVQAALEPLSSSVDVLEHDSIANRLQIGTLSHEINNLRMISAPHFSNVDIHITEEERQSWNSGAGAISAVDSVRRDLTSHRNNTVAHLSDTERLHFSNVDIHLSEQDRFTLDDLALSVISSEINTPEGSTEHAISAFKLDEVQTYTGVVQSLSMQAGSLPLSSEPYLILIEEQSEDGSSWVEVGFSTNAVTYQADSELVWSFDDLEIHGRTLNFTLVPQMILALSNNAGELLTDRNERILIANSPVQIYVMASESTDGSSVISGGNELDYTPQITLKGTKETKGYTRPEELQAHTQDSTAHLTAAEHAKLANLLARYDEILTLLNN